jgi:hypothetical protein
MPNSKHLTHGISNLVSLITKTKFGLSPTQRLMQATPTASSHHQKIAEGQQDDTQMQGQHEHDIPDNNDNSLVPMQGGGDGGSRTLPLNPPHQQHNYDLPQAQAQAPAGRAP